MPRKRSLFPKRPTEMPSKAVMRAETEALLGLNLERQNSYQRQSNANDEQPEDDSTPWQ